MTSALPADGDCFQTSVSWSASLRFPLRKTRRSSAKSVSRPEGRGSGVADPAIWMGISWPLMDRLPRFIQRRACSRSQRNSIIMSVIRPWATKAHLVDHLHVLLNHRLYRITRPQALCVFPQSVAQNLVRQDPGNGFRQLGVVHGIDKECRRLAVDR